MRSAAIAVICLFAFALLLFNRRLRREIFDRKQFETIYHDLVDTSQDLIWRCDGEGRFTFLNPAWEHELGYPASAMLGRPFTDFLSPEVTARDLAEF